MKRRLGSTGVATCKLRHCPRPWCSRSQRIYKPAAWIGRRAPDSTPRGAFQYRDLALVIGLVLKQSADQRPHRNAGPGRWVALVPDPPDQVLRFEVIHRALEIVLSGLQLLERRAPRFFTATRVLLGPVTAW